MARRGTKLLCAYCRGPDDSSRILYPGIEVASVVSRIQPIVKVDASSSTPLCGPSPNPTARKRTPTTRKTPSWHQNPGSPTVDQNRLVWYADHFMSPVIVDAQRWASGSAVSVMRSPLASHAVLVPPLSIDSIWSAQSAKVLMFVFEAR